MAPKSIAVLGGGITGLSAAFHLTRRFPTARIILLEKEKRLGGWIQSRRVDVGNANVLLETGPRTLRPNSKSVLEMVNLLNLQSTVLTTPKSAPAAKTRFLHIPPTPGLIPIPSTLWALLKSSLAPLLISSIIREPFRRNNSPFSLDSDGDESLDSLLSRRFSPNFARIFGSALVHGIYAADSRNLSARAAFPSVVDALVRGKGSLVRGMLFSSAKPEDETRYSYDMGNVQELMRDVAVFSFVDGIEVIPKAISTALHANPNVETVTNTSVHTIRPQTDHVEISTEEGTTLHPTHVVSAIPLPTFSSLLSTPAFFHLPFPTHIASNVLVTNLVFPCSAPLPEGFGYLIPRAANDESAYASSPGVLGTVFDSCSISGQDRGEMRVKKVTMMRGGPHPLPLAASSISPSSTIASADTSSARQQEELGHQAHSLLQSHLGTCLPPHLHTSSHLQQNCIPAPAVGHLSKVAALRKALEGEPWRGRVRVIGAGVDGVSVGDCVRAGREVGSGW